MLFNKNHADANLAKQIFKSIVECSGSAVSIGCDYYIMHYPSGYVKGYEIPKYQDDSVSLPPSRMGAGGPGSSYGTKTWEAPHSRGSQSTKEAAFKIKATNLGTSCWLLLDTRNHQWRQ